MSYLAFRLLNMGDHFIVVSQNLHEVKHIWQKVETIPSSRPGSPGYNAQCHYDGILEHFSPDTLVVAVVMPEWATRQYQLKKQEPAE